MNKRFYREFIPYKDSCPFRGDNRCSSSCAFFKDCTTSARCGLSSDIGNSTGYFVDQERQPYGNYH